LNYLQSWTKTVTRLVFLLCLSLVIGLYFDSVMLVCRNLSPPSAPGVWHHIYEGIYFLQRRNRSKRKNLGELVKRFREGSEALPDAVIVIDDQARITWCNRNARIELGLRWPEDSGRRIDNLIRHPKFIEFLQGNDYQYPIEIPAPTNPYKTFEYRVMSYGEDQLLIIIRDVSRVSHLEEMRKDFVANVSHELKTPLTVINGYLEVLGTSTNDTAPIVEKAIDEMGSQTRRMQNLIDDLLILSRIESSQERIFEKVIDMHAMFRQIELETQALNKDLQHKIVFKIDAELKVFGVESEMRSACSNLIFNALNYTPPGGNIKVIWKNTAAGAYFAGD